MNVISKTALAALVMTASSLWAADPGVTFVGRGEIKGDSSDRSGLSGDICQKENPGNCIPISTFGGFGSAMAYSGFDNVFLGVSRPGPIRWADRCFVSRPFSFLTYRCKSRRESFKGRAEYRDDIARHSSAQD